MIKIAVRSVSFMCIAILAATVAFARPGSVLINPGVYDNIYFKVTVRPTNIAPVLEITLSGKEYRRAPFIRFFLNPDALVASETPEQLVLTPQMQTVASQLDDGSTKLEISSGGLFRDHTFRTEMIIRADGELAAMSGLTKFAMFHLPNGWHSGLLKRARANYDCKRVLRRP